MTLLLGQCVEHIRHSLAGPIDSSIGARSVIQQAGNWLMTAHRWRFMERGTAHLDKRGAIALTAASWTEATRTLSLAAAFTNYTHLEGDEIEITDGTNTTLGFYRIVSKTDANSIVLATSIGATASAISGTMNLGGIRLPTDFAEVIALIAKAGWTQDPERVNHKDLLYLRTSVTPGPTYAYSEVWGDVLAGTNGSPTPRLEVYPYPQSNETGAFQLFYRQKWVTPVGDQERMPLPEFMEPLFLTSIRATARGWEEEDNATLEARLTEIAASALFVSAARYDGAIQTNIGKIQGGAAAKWFGRAKSWFRTDVIVETP